MGGWEGEYYLIFLSHFYQHFDIQNQFWMKNCAVNDDIDETEACRTTESVSHQVDGQNKLVRRIVRLSAISKIPGSGL